MTRPGISLTTRRYPSSKSRKTRKGGRGGGRAGRLVSSLEAADSTTLPLVGRVGRPHLRTVDPLQPAHFDFLRRGRRRQILIQQPRLRLRNVTIGQGAHDHTLLSPVWTADHQLITGAERPILFRRLVVHVDLSAPAGVLGLRPRPEQAGDIEPDVETDGRRVGTRHGRELSEQMPGILVVNVCARWYHGTNTICNRLARVLIIF